VEIFLLFLKCDASIVRETRREIYQKATSGILGFNRKEFNNQWVKRIVAFCALNNQHTAGGNYGYGTINSTRNDRKSLVSKS